MRDFKLVFSVFCFFALASVSWAQTVGSENAQPVKNKKNLVSAPAPKTADTRNQPPKAVKSTETVKAQEPSVKLKEEEEYSEVMIDKLENQEDVASPQETVFQPRKSDGDIPAAYGTLKGAFSENGKNIMVFEDEYGTISFVQVNFDRDRISCKLLGSAGRN